ncbi:MAG TPA: glycosyltransferase [Anaerolineales bacterium]|nr:glycosyltransferase [Anaerolineales bacterium]
MLSTNLSNARALFLVWAEPTHGSSRSREFSKELGIQDLHYVHTRLRQRPLTAPVRYLSQALQTIWLLFTKRPRIVFVQSPPSFAVFFVYLYCLFTGSRYVVDAHNGVFDIPIWSYPKWLTQRMTRKAIATIVTDEHQQRIVESWGGKAIILRDPITTYPMGEFPLNGSFNLAVVNSFSSDEPLEEVLKTAADLKGVRFYVTGKKSAADAQLLTQAPSNVIFTDYLPDEMYYGLLKSSDAVMCLTTSDHTLQCGACEALSLGKPIITSDWTLLREYFHRGTVHVQNTSAGIRQGVIEMQNNYGRYLAGIQELRNLHRHEWSTQAEELIGLIKTSTAN